MRDSCIRHRQGLILSVVREDYYWLMGKDNIAAALMNYFEFLANGFIVCNAKLENKESIYVGKRSIHEIERFLLGAATNRHIRSRLVTLQEKGFITIHEKSGHSNSFTVHVAKIQQALDELDFNPLNNSPTSADTPAQRDRVQEVDPPTKGSGTPAQRDRVQESEPSQGAEPGSPKNKKEFNNQESKEEYTPLPPREMSGSVGNFEASMRMRSQIPEWKVDHTTFREEIIRSVHEAFPDLYSLPDGRMNRVKILRHLQNLEKHGDFQAFETYWSAVKDSVLDQCSGADKSVQQENWLQLARELGQEFYRDRDGGINAARYQWFVEHSEELWA